MYRAQRAFDKVDQLIERHTAAVREVKKVAREQLGPYAINWSDEEQQIYILSLKEQRQTRRWWRQLRSFGLRREGGENTMSLPIWCWSRSQWTQRWPGVSKIS